MREYLKEKRIVKGYTQSQMAEKIDISRSYYCKIETGDRTPSTGLAKKIAETLNFEWTKFYE